MWLPHAPTAPHPPASTSPRRPRGHTLCKWPPLPHFPSPPGVWVSNSQTNSWPLPPCLRSVPRGPQANMKPRLRFSRPGSESSLAVCAEPELAQPWRSHRWSLGQCRGLEWGGAVPAVQGPARTGPSWPEGGHRGPREDTSPFPFLGPPISTSWEQGLYSQLQALISLGPRPPKSGVAPNHHRL